jgi:hypothetical protein
MATIHNETIGEGRRRETRLGAGAPIIRGLQGGCC